jgi:hypothetical protein
MTDIENTEDDIEQKVLDRLQKKNLLKLKSEKQATHIAKLAEAKKGSKYIKVQPKKEEEIEEEEKPIIQPKPKKSKKIVYVSESESEEEIVIKKKKTVKKISPVKKAVKKPVKKAVPKKKPKEVEQEPIIIQPVSRFRTRIC